MNDFFKQYKHPKWQKKRLEILERDDYTCIECGETEKELQVHHGYYEKDKKPWEYPDASLTTLCQPCHEITQHTINDIKKLVGCLTVEFQDRAFGYIKALASLDLYFHTPGRILDRQISVWKPSNFEEIIGMSEAFHEDPQEVNRIMMSGLAVVRLAKLANLETDGDGQNTDS